MFCPSFVSQLYNFTTGRSETLSTMTSLHSYRNGGFPPANKLLNKIWNHEDYKRHKKKVTSNVLQHTIALSGPIQDLLLFAQLENGCN